MGLTARLIRFGAWLLVFAFGFLVWGLFFTLFLHLILNFIDLIFHIVFQIRDVSLDVFGLLVALHINLNLVNLIFTRLFDCFLCSFCVLLHLLDAIFGILERLFSICLCLFGCVELNKLCFVGLQKGCRILSAFFISLFSRLLCLTDDFFLLSNRFLSIFKCFFEVINLGLCVVQIRLVIRFEVFD